MRCSSIYSEFLKATFLIHPPPLTFKVFINQRFNSLKNEVVQIPTLYLQAILSCQNKNHIFHVTYCFVLILKYRLKETFRKGPKINPATNYPHTCSCNQVLGDPKQLLKSLRKSSIHTQYCQIPKGPINASTQESGLAGTDSLHSTSTHKSLPSF